MPYQNSAGQTVPAHVALDASGRQRPGYGLAPSSIIEDGGQVHFDLMLVDAQPAPSRVFLRDSVPAAAPLQDARPGRFVSPAEARQAEIQADCARTAEARQIIRDAYIGEQVANTMAERSSGVGRADIAALRDARLTGQPAALSPAAPAQVADNSAFIAGLRAARYL